MHFWILSSMQYNASLAFRFFTFIFMVKRICRKVGEKYKYSPLINSYIFWLLFIPSSEPKQLTSSDIRVSNVPFYSLSNFFLHFGISQQKLWVNVLRSSKIFVVSTDWLDWSSWTVPKYRSSNVYTSSLLKPPYSTVRCSFAHSRSSGST